MYNIDANLNRHLHMIFEDLKDVNMYNKLITELLDRNISMLLNVLTHDEYSFNWKEKESETDQ